MVVLEFVAAAALAACTAVACRHGDLDPLGDGAAADRGQAVFRAEEALVAFLSVGSPAPRLLYMASVPTAVLLHS